VSEERVERRLAAILAADVVGYSRLMGQDEAGTLARLRALRRDLIDPKIANHKGRIVKTTGDGILVEFPSVVGAVACAVAFQRELAQQNIPVPQDHRIEFRVGINLGDVIVEDDDIHGDGVNVAARLEALAEPGGLCVSGIVHDQIHGRLEVSFEDIGEQSLKNIVRPVRVFQARLGGARATAEAARPALALPDKPSIAVLPFQNMSGDPEQEFFADGVVEDIITLLSKSHGLFVIARNSTFTYKGRAVDIKRVGEELRVRYVLEGSVRKAGSRVRVTAQLIEAASGRHLWAEHYDRDLADIFAVQDEITQTVMIAIAPAIAETERQRAMRKLPGSLDAWGAYQRGMWHSSKETSEHNALAEKFFQQAIDLDPNFVGGYSRLANTRVAASDIYGTLDRAEGLKSAEMLVRRAIELDSSDAEARATLATVLMARGDRQGALAEANRALAMTPNLSLAHGQLGLLFTFSGQPKEGLASLETATRLNPLGTGAARRLSAVATAQYFYGDYEAAVETAKKGIRSYPDFPPLHRWLAASLGQLGRTEEAREALEKAIAVAPGSLETYARSRMPWFRPEDHAHMLEGLRKAGWNG
jgi:adenylate cyclase